MWVLWRCRRRLYTAAASCLTYIPLATSPTYCRPDGARSKDARVCACSVVNLSKINRFPDFCLVLQEIFVEENVCVHENVCIHSNGGQMIHCTAHAKSGKKRY